MKPRNVRPVTSQDYRELAAKRLPRFLFEYIDGAAHDEWTLAVNQADFGRLRLRQRVLRDVSEVDTRTMLSGQAASMPLALAPVGLAGMMARRGEVQGVRAANAAGVPFTLSTVGICPLEEVRGAATEPFWFQLYMVRDRDLVVQLLERARALGVETLVFTVDLPVTGMRHRDWRNGMVGEGLAVKLAKARQMAVRPRWVLDVGLLGRPHDFGNLRKMMGNSNDLDAYKKFISSEMDATVTWKDIAWLRSLWPGRILLKGIMDTEDARAAIGVGANGLIVSNHGGRQLESGTSTVRKLPEIVTAVGDLIEVYLDSGVRNGVDVVKAVALGARGVLIGRPWVWAVAARGKTGLADLLAVFQQEIATTMALMGINRIADLGPDVFESAPGISD